MGPGSEAQALINAIERHDPCWREQLKVPSFYSHGGTEAGGQQARQEGDWPDFEWRSETNKKKTQPTGLV